VSIRPDGTGSRIETGGGGTRSYWQPSGLRSVGTLVAHGSDAPGVPAGQRMTFSATFATGPFLASHAPFPRVLPDRTVNVYPIRFFAAVLHPIRDLIIQGAPAVPELLATRIDGTERRSVFTFLRRTDGPPISQSTGDGFRWSRDGQWLLVTQGQSSFNAASEADIWKVRFDGTELQNLTPNSPGNDNHPGFSGDGREIIFRSSRSGNFDLYLMNADGTNVTA
jgi:hypothetical protein